MLPAVSAIVALLLEKNLTKIAQVVIDKGVDYVSSKTGVELTPTMSSEQLAKLEESASKLDEFRMEKLTTLATVEAANISSRWSSDMSSDSWLSKNIRPSCLTYILGLFTVFAIGSAFGLQVKETYVTLLGEWGQIVMVSYFGARTIDKAVELFTRRK